MPIDKIGDFEMLIEWDVPIEMDDGNVLRADVFRPNGGSPVPVLMTHGPYGKGVAFQDLYAYFWKVMEDRYPETTSLTSNKYAVFETPDPEYWVPHGYAIIRVDLRGSGRSPGVIDPWSEREIQDYYNCIEWAGTQPWCNGNVGSLGVSYYAMSQWHVAALNPPHLKAICPWEGSTDFYRDMSRQGGILTSMVPAWYESQVAKVQHGKGTRMGKNPNTGEYYSGPETLSDEELEQNRIDWVGNVTGDDLLSDWYEQKSADTSKITIPILATANWAAGGHLRGCCEGFMNAACENKWFEFHGLENWVEFYTPYGLDLQNRFFDYFLKGVQNGWEKQPRVTLKLRNPDGSFTLREENEWPIKRTEWVKFYLDGSKDILMEKEPVVSTSQTFNAKSPGLTFFTDPMATDTEITGPASAKLFVSSDTDDADIFVALRLIDPDGKEVYYSSLHDDRGVPALGWLRASHRKLDPQLSRPERPWHTHDEKQPLEPGKTYELDIEIWPTSIIAPAGYRIGFTIMGRDFEFQGDGPWPVVHGIEMRGVGAVRHDYPTDRTDNLVNASITVLMGNDAASYVMLPVIPGR